MTILRRVAVHTFVLFALLAGAAIARSQPVDDSVIPSIDRIDMSMGFAETRAVFPGLAWEEKADTVRDRYWLHAESALEIVALPFAVALSAGETGLYEIVATWRGEGFAQERCEAVGLSFVAEMERQVGVLRPAPKEAFGDDGFVTATYRTVAAGPSSAIAVHTEEVVRTRAGDIGGHVEWQAAGVANDGRRIEALGQYFGLPRFGVPAGYCSAQLTITNPRVKARRLEERPVLRASPPRE
jgi:hypothetical protein